MLHGSAPFWFPIDKSVRMQGSVAIIQFEDFERTPGERSYAQYR
jgi:hypothetical protein